MVRVNPVNKNIPIGEKIAVAKSGSYTHWIYHMPPTMRFYAPKDGKAETGSVRLVRGSL